MSDERNGFRVKGWGDLLAVIAILTMMASAITWALTLQAGKEDAQKKLAEHEQRITRLESEQ